MRLTLLTFAILSGLTYLSSQGGIDLNKSGRIDLYENVYKDLDTRVHHLISLLTLEEKAI